MRSLKTFHPRDFYLHFLQKGLCPFFTPIYLTSCTKSILCEIFRFCFPDWTLMRQSTQHHTTHNGPISNNEFALTCDVPAHWLSSPTLVCAEFSRLVTGRDQRCRIRRRTQQSVWPATQDKCKCHGNLFKSVLGGKWEFPLYLHFPHVFESGHRDINESLS